MIEKCCKNCLFFGEDIKKHRHYTEVKYHCELHGSEASITHPDTQFCGHEHWISVKVKTRLENLEKLGI